MVEKMGSAAGFALKTSKRGVCGGNSNKLAMDIVKISAMKKKTTQSE